MGEQVILNKPEEVTVANPFEITPKAFANFSPGFERSEPWAQNIN
jgi:hypothetical protein